LFKFKKNFSIGKTQVGVNSKAFIVAEISANHDQKLDKALRLVREAKKAGANAIKLQTFKPESLTIKTDGQDLKPSKTPWSKYKSRYELFKKASLPWEWHKKIYNEAKKNKLEIFSSPFDLDAVKFLKKINSVAYKIASPEITDTNLINSAAKTKKPIIISIGAAKINDIKKVVKIVKLNKNSKLILLKCIAEYPADPKDLNLKTIPYMRKKFKCLIGFSDHTLGMGASIAATSLGACVIEKHLKLENDNTSIDSFFSITPSQFKKMVKEIRNAENSIGKVSFSLGKNQKIILESRRSLYASKNIKKGEKFTNSNVKSVRPGNGLHPEFLKKIIKKKSAKNILKGSPLKLKYIKFK
jgi:pseudaminic acid synthase